MFITVAGTVDESHIISHKSNLHNQLKYNLMIFNIFIKYINLYSKLDCIIDI